MFLTLLIFLCTIKSRKFSSGTGSPGWSRKKGPKTVVVWCGTYAVLRCDAITITIVLCGCLLQSQYHRFSNLSHGTPFSTLTSPKRPCFPPRRVPTAYLHSQQALSRESCRPLTYSVRLNGKPRRRSDVKDSDAVTTIRKLVT